MKEFLQNKLKARDILVLSITGAFAALFLQWIILHSPLPELFPAYDETVRENMFSVPLPFQVLLYGFLSPVYEELIFRLLLFVGAVRFLHMPLPVSALISSLIFGLYHGNMIQFCYASLFGLLLSYLTNRYKCVFAPIVSHSSANLITVFIRIILP